MDTIVMFVQYCRFFKIPDSAICLIEVEDILPFYYAAGDGIRLWADEDCLTIKAGAGRVHVSRVKDIIEHPGYRIRKSVTQEKLLETITR